MGCKSKHLQSGKRIHPLYRTAGAQRQTILQTLTGLQSGNVHRNGRGHAEAVFVELYREACHGLHGFISQVHFHVNLSGSSRKRSLNLQTFALIGRQPESLKIIAKYHTSISHFHLPSVVYT